MTRFAQCPFDVCKGNAIYFDLAEAGKEGAPNFATMQTNTSEAYLRLRREGTTYSGYYSEDGMNWTLIGEHTSNIQPLSVGLVAAQAYEGETIADFDYFKIQALSSSQTTLEVPVRVSALCPSWGARLRLTFRREVQLSWRGAGLLPQPNTSKIIWIMASLL